MGINKQKQMKFIVIAAAAAIAITSEAPEEDANLVEVDEAVAEFPQEDEMPEVGEDEEGWGKVRRSCAKLRKVYRLYSSYASVRYKLKRAAAKRYHGRSLRSWCAYAGVRLGF